MARTKTMASIDAKIEKARRLLKDESRCAELETLYAEKRSSGGGLITAIEKRKRPTRMSWILLRAGSGASVFHFE